MEAAHPGLLGADERDHDLACARAARTASARARSSATATPVASSLAPGHRRRARDVEVERDRERVEHDRRDQQRPPHERAAGQQRGRGGRDEQPHRLQRHDGIRAAGANAAGRAHACPAPDATRAPSSPRRCARPGRPSPAPRRAPGCDASALAPVPPPSQRRRHGQRPLASRSSETTAASASAAPRSPPSRGAASPATLWPAKLQLFVARPRYGSTVTSDAPAATQPLARPRGGRPLAGAGRVAGHRRKRLDVGADAVDVRGVRHARHVSRRVGRERRDSNPRPPA